DVGLVAVSQNDGNGKNSRKRPEVDFVCNKASKRYYIQSAFAIPDNEKMRQESNSLMNIDDSFKKIIIVKDTPTLYYTEQGLMVMSIYDFLLNENSLDL
ncbi:MAG: ATP-binding protein, partial [Butyrivibrio sp.]|nr:ATP-binding protein [Butyrivibrio sp.]